MSNLAIGLRGIQAAETSICTVGKEGKGLHYRGFNIEDMTDTTFEDIAFLLIYQHLPNAKELKEFGERLQTKRKLPDKLKNVLEQIPSMAHPMSVLSTAVAFLGNIEPEKDTKQQYEIAERLLAVMPSVLLYWYHYSHFKKRIETETKADSIATHFLTLLYQDDSFDTLFTKVMHISLILYAEHEFNASTFNARVCAATLSDIHSAICSAIGTLKGPLHGGANEAAMEMIEKIKNEKEALEIVDKKLEKKEKIMGFGHAIYKIKDPRNGIIKIWAKKLAEKYGDDTLYRVSSVIEERMWEKKKIFANADFFHASAYHYMKIPTKLFTPIFVLSRLSGWLAHIFEQRENNKLIRPNAKYIGPAPKEWLSLDKRIV